MQVLIVNQAEVRRLLPMAECLGVMEEALGALARGEALLPLRQVLMLPGGQAALAAMPAHLSSPAAMGIKVISVFPGNHGTELDSHQGAVLLFETERGRLLAIMDASSITAIRTAAVSGVATRLLARPEASTLALLGSGVQAATHLEAIALVRPLRRVSVWSRDRAHAARFAEAARARHPLDVQVAATAREAVQDADVVCTVTSSREPVLQGRMAAPGHARQRRRGQHPPPRASSTRRRWRGRASSWTGANRRPARPATSSSRARKARSATTTSRPRSARC